MNQGFRILAGVGIIVALIAGAALFVINRSRGPVSTTPTPTPGPLGETPFPTFIPFGSATPFPLLTLPTASPIGSPRSLATASGSPRATGTPAAVFRCQYLAAQPTSGSAPLSVRFTAAGFGTIAPTIREYEFSFGDGTNSVRQATNTASHRFESAGSFIATLRIRDSQGNVIAIPGGDCRQTITVQAQPTVAGSPTASKQLPKTGPEDWLWIAILPLIGSGVYLYKKFRLL